MVILRLRSVELNNARSLLIGFLKKVRLGYDDFFFDLFTKLLVVPASAAFPEGCLDVGWLDRGPVTGSGAEKSGSLVISFI